MFRDLLKAAIPTLSPDQLDLLSSHYETLIRWNKVLNLTRVTSAEEVVERHYLESIALARLVPAAPVVDIGSGAGFPGIPLAVVRPECEVTLVESHRRKAAFLKESTRGWLNVRVLAERIEEIKGSFGAAVSRAVRWEEIEAAAARLAGSAVVLGGPESPGGSLFEWNAPVRVPSGERRFIWSGRNVSCETPQENAAGRFT